MTEECPLCEQPASATAKVRMGNSWRDTFGKPPHTLLSKYPMVHFDGQTAYLHSKRDLQ